MNTHPSYSNIQKFTRKYGTIQLKQDAGGVVVEAKKPGFLVEDTVYEEGPFATVLEAMNQMEQELGEWMKDQWW